MNLRNLYFVICMFLVLDCSQSQKTIVPPLEELDVAYKEDVYIPLDAETSSIGNNYYELLEDDSKTHLVFFNPLNFTLYTYDLITRKLIGKRKFEAEGPNGLGSRITSFRTLSDSVVVFHSYYKAELIFVDSEESVIARHKLRLNDFDFAPVTSQKAPFVLIDNGAYIYSGKVASGAGDLGFPVVLKYGLMDSSGFDTGVRLPPLYKTAKNEHFPADLSEVYIAENSLKNLLIASFPLDDSIRVLTAGGEIQAKYLGVSAHQLKKPLRNMYDPSNPMDQMKDVLRFSRYSSVRYDPYRNVYMRTFYESTSDDLLKQNKFETKRKTVFADHEFNILGVADSYGVDQVLFSRDGPLEVIFDGSQEDSLWIRRYEYGF